MSWASKEELVKRIATSQAQLFRQKFSGIGNLYLASMSPQNYGPVSASLNQASSSAAAITVGRIVSLAFFWGHCLAQDIFRGPFYNTYDWIETRLSLVITEQTQKLEATDDDGEISDIEAVEAHLPKDFLILSIRYFLKMTSRHFQPLSSTMIFPSRIYLSMKMEDLRR